MLHESTVSQTVPDPEYPVLHVHVRDAPPLLQVAFESHPPFFTEHETNTDPSPSESSSPDSRPSPDSRDASTWELVSEPCPAPSLTE